MPAARRRFTRFCIPCLAVIVSTMCGGPAAAQWQGTEAFRRILLSFGCQPIHAIDEALADPKSTLIVLFGETTMYDEEFANGGLRRFLRRGGAILVATDFDSSGVIGEQLEAQVLTLKNQDQLYDYKIHGPFNNPDVVYEGKLLSCPLLQPPSRETTKSPIDLLGKLHRVATNLPNLLRIKDEFSGATLDRHRIIAELPAGCRIVYSRRIYDTLVDPRCFAIAGEMGRGRYVMLADHSIFINVMLLKDDNDNIPFTVNVVQWLTEGKRTRALFVDGGKVHTDFNVDLDAVDPPLPHPDVLGPTMDHFIENLERDDFFNRLIGQLASRNQIMRGALLGLTILTCAYVLYRLTSARYRVEGAAHRLPDRIDSLATAPAGPMPPAAAARELAAAAFARLFGSTFDPRFRPQVDAGNWFARQTWTARVRSLWDVAAGARFVESDDGLIRLANEIHDLEQAALAGAVRLTIGDNR